MSATASDIARRLKAQERSPLVTALAVALAVALIALLVVSWKWHAASARYHAEKDARKVAEERTVQMLTWTSATLDDDAAWAKDGATEKFQSDYDEYINNTRETYAALSASSSGTVLASSPQASSSDKVAVTLYALQTVGQGGSIQPTCVLSSIVLTMVHEDGDWLVDAPLEAPGAPVTVPC
ncbi:MAG: hypothetical protein QM597_08005 [Aeromicrobium sp.]|uniref:hypothetical protein n=1 Tax=Aeromicrobium sp. TaxID=1871063 RepID=UPI0039E681F7